MAVVGVPDPQWGERPFALLVLREEQALDARGLKEHLKPFVEQGHINKWAIPTQIALVTEIPKTSVGKLDKKRIRIEIAQWQEAGSGGSCPRCEVRIDWAVKVTAQSNKRLAC